MAADEEVTLSFNADEDITEALRRIENRLDATERKFVETGATARAAGHEIAEGVEEAEGASEGLGRSQEELGRKVRKTSDDLDDQGKKAGKHGSQLDDLAKKTAKASKTFGGMGRIFSMFKWGAMIQGAALLVPLVYALGAAAGMAVGNLASMAGVIGPMGALFLAAKVGMWAWKLAAEAIKPQTDALSKSFKDLGPQIAKGGLSAGLDSLNTKMKGFVAVTGDGLTQVGSSIGKAADILGDFTQRQDTLDLTTDLFASLDRILQHLLSAALTMLPGVLRLLDSIMPAGERLAGMIDNGTTKLNAQMVAWTESGRAAAFFNRALDKTITFVKAVWNFLVGLYNILKIGSAAAGDLSGSLLSVSERFRAFTESASGQASIASYFAEAKPVLHELWLLIKDIVKGLGGLGSSNDLAALISQIRTELLPPLLDVLHNVTGAGGLLPALVSLAAAFLRLFATIDPQGLVIIAQALVAVANGLAWAAENIPGFGMLLTVLFTLLTVLGPILWVAAKVLRVMAFLGPVFGTAAEGAAKLTAGQRVLKGAIDLVGKAFGPIGRLLSTAFSSVGGWIARVAGWFLSFESFPALLSGIGQVVLRVIMGIGAAFLEMTPIGWVITIGALLIGLFVLLYTKCQWFRDFVDGLWGNIVQGAKDMWSGIVTAWDWCMGLLSGAWDWISTSWRTTVDFIVGIASWIWDHGLKQVVGLIVGGFKLAFDIVSFIVRLNIYIIAGLIKLILMAAEWCWSGIIAAAKWMAGILVGIWNWIVGVATTAWNWLYANVIGPIVDSIRLKWAMLVAFFTFLWTTITNAAAFAWNWLLTNIIYPIVDGIRLRWAMLVAFFTYLWGVITAAASAVWRYIYDGVIAPVATWVELRWLAISTFFSRLWEGIRGPAVSMWTSLRETISGVADVVRGAWDTVVNAIKGSYNWVADVWNGLPSIHVLGMDFEVPKLPKWLEGGYTGGQFGLAGEAGPEPIMRGSSMIGMAGLNGPEMGTMPRGSYVVPHPSTLASTPGLAASLPSSVASAISRAMPGAYGDILGGTETHGTTPTAPPPPPRPDGSAALGRAVRGLTAVLDERPPPISVSGGASAEDNRRMVREELARDRARRAERAKYDYDD